MQQGVALDAWTHIEDRELLEKFYSEDNNYWLGILLERYTLLLLGVCMKYLKDEDEAKDAVQQIFLKVITELKKYGVEYFKSWLYMVAKNQCLMKLRAGPGRKPLELDSNAITADIITKTDLLEKDNILQMVEDGVNELNEEQKLCVTLFYLQKKSYQEITLSTGFSLLQVKSYIQNGKRNLKMIVEKKLKQING